MTALKRIFITGTGTGVGKTLIACAIARYWSARGFDVGVLKPVASGGTKTKNLLVSEDAAMLKKAARSDDPIELINPVCYRFPLAPYSASALERKPIAWKKIQNAFDAICRKHERVLVEGIGGAAVPIDAENDVSDMTRMLQLPAVVVASAGLGTLNHTLLTLNHLKMKRIKVLGIVLNYFDSRRLADKTNLRFFLKRKIPVLAAFPSNPRFSQDFNLAARQIPLHPRLKDILA